MIFSDERLKFIESKSLKQVSSYRRITVVNNLEIT